MWTLKKNKILLTPFSLSTLFLILILSGIIPVYAQKKSSAKSVPSVFPYQWGLGIKVGDPTGISIKKYNGNKALELIVGYPYYYSSYYGHRFNHDHRYKNYAFGNPYQYSSRSCIQFRYLIQNDFQHFKGFRWYAGAGAQLRTVSYYFDYRDQAGNKLSARTLSVNLGVDGIIGLEYTFDDLPLSVFADMNLYVELYRLPLYLEGQGGIGIRYNLR
ncbi:MAG: hypothetical protein ACJ75J_06955 [Cytophagaceae bacterium]